jgi:hypothetical protein
VPSLYLQTSTLPFVLCLENALEVKSREEEKIFSNKRKKRHYPNVLYTGPIDSSTAPPGIAVRY